MGSQHGSVRGRWGGRSDNPVGKAAGARAPGSSTRPSAHMLRMTTATDQPTAAMKDLERLYGNRRFDAEWTPAPAPFFDTVEGRGLKRTTS